MKKDCRTRKRGTPNGDYWIEEESIVGNEGVQNEMEELESEQGTTTTLEQPGFQLRSINKMGCYELAHQFVID